MDLTNFPGLLFRAYFIMNCSSDRNRKSFSIIMCLQLFYSFSDIPGRRYNGFRDELEQHSLSILTRESFFSSGLSPVEFLRRLQKRFPETTTIDARPHRIGFYAVDCCIEKLRPFSCN